MHLKTIRLSNFQAFGPTPEEITFEEITYILGPNGAGKTTVLEALSRLFSPIAAQRRIEALDFHVPIAKPEEDPLNSPTLWIEADFEF
uniref:AAA family ATPase n=2 Tax=Bacteria TaxID=2 RepID=UPI0010920DB8